MPRWAGALLAVTALLAGCSEDTACVEAAATADCASAVRYGNTVYVEGGISSQAVEPLGEADRAACHDTGPNALGACFPDEPTQVSIARFAGHDPRQVVGARINDVMVVLFADDVPEEVRREIARSGLVDPGTGPYPD